MKRHAILLALILLVVLAGNVAAAVTALNVPRNVIAGGGGGEVAGGNFVLTGTIGQPVTGVVSQGSYGLCSGFWCNLEFLRTFLPLIGR